MYVEKIAPIPFISILIFFSNLSWGSHWQYLTIIGLSLATLTFVSGLLADLTLSSRLFYLKNALSVATAPMEVLISILYWSIQAVRHRYDPLLFVWK